MRSEYEFDYRRAKPNRFAARMNRPVIAVVLESDVAAAFDTSAKVNAQLRSAISTQAAEAGHASTSSSPEGGLTSEWSRRERARLIRKRQ